MMERLAKHVIWWSVFVFATYALSKVFEASRLLTSESPEASFFNLLVWIGAMMAAIVVLGYDSYVKARAEGKVVHRIGLYERFYRLRHREGME